VKKRYFYQSYSFLLIFFVLFNISCVEGKVWDISVEEIQAKCRVADYSFLNDIDFKEQKIEDIKNIGPGAFYYFYKIFKSIGKPELALQTLIVGSASDEGDWRELCYLQLIENSIEANNYSAAEQYALNFLRKYKSSEKLNDVKKYYAEALYWQDKDEETLKFLDTIKQWFDPELILFKVVSLHRTGKPGWKELLLNLCLEEKSALLHARVYRYMEIEKELDHFTESELSLFKAKYLINLGKNEEAIPLLKYVIAHYNKEQLENSTIFSELGTAMLNSGIYADGAAYFAALVDTFKGNALLTIQEMASRLYRKIPENSKARFWLKAVFTVTPDHVQRDRLLWYYLNNYFQVAPDKGVTEICTWANLFDDPAYFTDLMEEVISYLVAARKWDSLLELYRNTKDYVTPSISVRLSYIVKRIIDLKYVILAADEAKKLIDEFPDPRLYWKGVNYYNFLFNAIAGKATPEFDTRKVKDRKAILNNQQDRLINGLFDYGFIDEASENVRKNLSTLQSDTIIRTVKAHFAREEYRQGVTLMMKYLLSDKFTFNVADLEYLYPYMYANIITEQSKVVGIDPLLVFAIIYEESAFDKDNESDAGAVGLMQLMPETTNDMAELLRIKNPNLRDPEVNVKIGVKYMARLLTRISDLPNTIMAYNAGPTRVRNWASDYKGLPLDLMVEAIPYEETRKYVRQVMESMIMYGTLYFNQNYINIIKLFFPYLLSDENE